MVKAVQIVEGIHKVDEASSNMAHSNVYLIIGEKDLVVVDTGTAGNAKKIVSYIQKLGRNPSEVSTIILTHYHMDHVGSAKELKELTGAKVAASIEDAGVISGQKSYPGLLMRVASFIKPAPVDVDILLKDGDTLCGLTVLLTPGHTQGSIMLLDKQRHVLFTGDMLRSEDGRVTGAPKRFTWDGTKEKESLRRVAGLDFDVMLPGHAECLVGNASGLVKAFVNQQL